MTHKLSARPFSFALKTRLTTYLRTTYLRTTYLQTIHLQTIFRITEKPPSHFFIRRFSGFIAALSLSHAALAAPVFINEFHYDNNGTDNGEGLEVAAIAGTSLDNWQLLFYNGSNGEIYKSLNLNGVVNDLDNGYGVLGFPTSGIQNGPADAFALVNPLGEVLDFISYEGSLTATEGPANGLTSIDVGLEELPDSLLGLSLQRQGNGTLSDDFNWAIDTASLGNINNEQDFQVSSVPLPASLWLFSTACIALLGRQRCCHRGQQKR
jgi:hypothetical protein